MLDASADWKMRRAKKHLQQMEAAYRQVELENGHSLPFEVQIGAGQTGDFGRMVYPGPDWSLMVGDSVQNMRAALDHCTWALSSREVRNRRPNEIEFPIFDSRAKYSSGKAKRLRGVPDEAVAIIDTLQPSAYGNQNPHFHPLWLLHDLARIDRHRQIHVALMAVQGSLLKRDDASTQAAWVPVEGAKSGLVPGATAASVIAARTT